MAESVNFTPYFIGGAPRSGTTALHALVCTSPKVNRHIAEVSYFSAFMHPFEVGLASFDIHTRHYFASREEFCANHASVLLTELTKIWIHVDRPPILALKDPLLTPSFPRLAQLLPNAKFIVAVRDPRSTISSRLEVLLRQHSTAPRKKDVKALCDEYAGYYECLINNLDEFGDRLCFIDYNQMVLGRAGSAIACLEAFGIGPIYPERIWQESLSNPKEIDQGAWISPLYGSPLTSASVDRYLRVLPEQIESFILDRCGEVAKGAGLDLSLSRGVTGVSAATPMAQDSLEEMTKDSLLRGWLASLLEEDQERAELAAYKAQAEEAHRLLAAELADYRAKVEETHQLLAAVMNSHSWRITKVARKLSRWLKQFSKCV